RRASGSASQEALKRRNGPPPKRLPAAPDDTVQVVVLAGGGPRAGLIVDRIVDIVAEPPGTPTCGHRPGVLFTAVLQGRVTEFLDINSILRSADPVFFQGTDTAVAQARPVDGQAADSPSWDKQSADS